MQIGPECYLKNMQNLMRLGELKTLLFWATSPDVWEENIDQTKESILTHNASTLVNIEPRHYTVDNQSVNHCWF